MKKLILWDIDGTLIASFEASYGVRPRIVDFSVPEARSGYSRDGADCELELDGR